MHYLCLFDRYRRQLVHRRCVRMHLQLQRNSPRRTASQLYLTLLTACKIVWYTKTLTHSLTLSLTSSLAHTYTLSVESQSQFAINFLVDKLPTLSQSSSFVGAVCLCVCMCEHKTDIALPSAVTLYNLIVVVILVYIVHDKQISFC